MSKKQFRLTELSVGDFVEKLAMGQIQMAPVPAAYPYGHFKDKIGLTASERQQLSEETDFLCNECCRDLPTVGGTRSSARVRRTLAHQVLLSLLVAKSGEYDGQDFQAQLQRTSTALEIAKKSLAKHNSQLRKFIAYDLETGEPLNEPDYSNVDLHEVIQSLGFRRGSPTNLNRAQRRKLKRTGTLH
jgi:hypothetical protein